MKHVKCKMRHTGISFGGGSLFKLPLEVTDGPASMRGRPIYLEFTEDDFARMTESMVRAREMSQPGNVIVCRECGARTLGPAAKDWDGLCERCHDKANGLSKQCLCPFPDEQRAHCHIHGAGHGM